MRIVILGLSVSSSWGNGHATTFRSLIKGLNGRGHSVLFLERNQPWYSQNRDLIDVPYGTIRYYDSLKELRHRFSGDVRSADALIVGSFVPEGVAVAEWVISTTRGLTAFYDIDTPITLSKLQSGDEEYISRELAPAFDLYLSFTGGPTLSRLHRELGVARPLPLYCSVDPDVYFPKRTRPRWDLGYLGTYSKDRQDTLDKLLLGVARQCTGITTVVAGSQYPSEIMWPSNVERREHLAPRDHCEFYNSQRFTLNITRADMRVAGYSPSVRLFEAAACGTPIISDWWEGIGSFFEAGREILIAHSSQDVLRFLLEMPEAEGKEIGVRALARILDQHTAFARASELEAYFEEARSPIKLTAERSYVLP